MIFLNQLVRGFRYAGIVIGVGTFFGFLYGGLSGLWQAPAFVMLSMIGLWSLVNFLIALLLVLVNLALAAFGRSRAGLFRYFAISLAFALVFVAYFGLVKLVGLETMT